MNDLIIFLAITNLAAFIFALILTQDREINFGIAFLLCLTITPGFALAVVMLVPKKKTPDNIYPPDYMYIAAKRIEWALKSEFKDMLFEKDPVIRLYGRMLSEPPEQIFRYIHFKDASGKVFCENIKPFVRNNPDPNSKGWDIIGYEL